MVYCMGKEWCQHSENDITNYQSKERICDKIRVLKDYI